MKMSKEEILRMPAGREMDALVAEKIFGWKWIEGLLPWGHPSLISPEHDRQETRSFIYTDKRKPSGTFPKYSTEVAAAWEIVEMIKASQTEIRIRGMDWYDGGGWNVEVMDIMSKKVAYESYVETLYPEQGRANVCLAICRVVLLTKLQ